MKEKIENFLKLQEEIIKELKKYVKDKTIPLETRWDLFVSSDLGDEDGYILRLESYDLDGYYDRSWCARYTTVEPEHIFEYLYDYELEDYEEELDYELAKVELEVTISNIKEELLSLFVKSWRFDW